MGFPLMRRLERGGRRAIVAAARALLAHTMSAAAMTPRTPSATSAPTASPSGGTFSDWLPLMGSTVALDDGGRAMVGASVRGGKSGLFLYENHQWRTAALLDTTQIDGETVRQVSMLRSAGRRTPSRS